MPCKVQILAPKCGKKQGKLPQAEKREQLQNKRQKQEHVPPKSDVVQQIYGILWCSIPIS